MGLIVCGQSMIVYRMKGMSMQTLQQLRKAAGFTQLKLAVRLGITPSTVYNWERGTAEPGARQLGDLATALGVTADEVLASLPEPQPKKAAA